MMLIFLLSLRLGCDDQVIGDLIPDGHSFHHVPRQLSNGGGVVIPVKNGFCVKEKTGLNRQFVSFEFIDLLITSDFSRDIRALVIYYSPCNYCSMFLDDFGCLLERYIQLNQNKVALVIGQWSFGHIEQ